MYSNNTEYFVTFTITELAIFICLFSDPLSVFTRSCCKVLETMPEGQCVPGETPCLLRGIYLFYDNFHPTEIANRIATSRAYNALLSSDAYPMDIHHLIRKSNVVYDE